MVKIKSVRKSVIFLGRRFIVVVIEDVNVVQSQQATMVIVDEW